MDRLYRLVFEHIYKISSIHFIPLMKVRFEMIISKSSKISAVMILNLIGVLSICNASVQTIMPRGAFLRQSVYTVAALLHEIHSDRVVRYRYARLFDTRPENVDRIFASLHLVEMAKTSRYDVCFVRKNGHFGFSHQKVRRGMLIFADRNGTPVLMQVCGNPFRMGWPKEFERPYSSTPYSDLQPSQTILEMAAADLYPPELRFNLPQEIRSISDVIKHVDFVPAAKENYALLPISDPIETVTHSADTYAALAVVPSWILKLIPPFQFLPHVALPANSYKSGGAVHGTFPIIPILFPKPPDITSGGFTTLVNPPIEPTEPGDNPTIPEVPEGGSIVIGLALAAGSLLFRRKSSKCK